MDNNSLTIYLSSSAYISNSSIHNLMKLESFCHSCECCFSSVIVFFCLFCEAEARHINCFSDVVVVFVSPANRSKTYVLLFRCHCRWLQRRLYKLLSSFCVKVIFSETVRARAMNLGSCIHLDECSSKPSSILILDLLFTVHWLCKFLLSLCI